MNLPRLHRISRPRLDYEFWLAWTEAAVTVALTIALIWGVAHAMGPIR